MRNLCALPVALGSEKAYFWNLEALHMGFDVPTCTTADSDERAVLLAAAAVQAGCALLSIVAIVQPGEGGPFEIIALDLGVPSDGGHPCYQRAWLVATQRWAGHDHTGWRPGHDDPCRVYKEGIRYFERNGGADCPPIEHAPGGSWEVHQWAAGWTYASQREDLINANKAIRVVEQARDEAQRIARRLGDEAIQAQATIDECGRYLNEAKADREQMQANHEKAIEDLQRKLTRSENENTSLRFQLEAARGKK